MGPTSWKTERKISGPAGDGKGKPRDLDYPACWTGARRCAPKSDCAPVPPNGKKEYGGARTAVWLPPTNNMLGFTHWAIGLPATEP